MEKQMSIESDFATEMANRIKDKYLPEAAENICAYQREIVRLNMLVRLLLERESLIIAETFNDNDEGSLALRVQKIILSPETQPAQAGHFECQD